jgi:AcrR family transcriptional regulator
MARTQQQRREETIARLLEASIDTIIEVGYARASAAVIARRAKVSDGALFRHFATMGDFMAATAHEVLRRQLELFAKEVAQIPAEKPTSEAVLTILRDVTGNPTNTVMYELLVAARTDEKLRTTLQDVLNEYATRIYDLGRSLPGADRIPPDSLAALVAVLTNTFDGAAIVRAVLPQPEIEASRIALLTSVLDSLGANVPPVAGHPAGPLPGPAACSATRGP